jgi:hypothetical protein
VDDRLERAGLDEGLVVTAETLQTQPRRQLLGIRRVASTVNRVARLDKRRSCGRDPHRSTPQASGPCVRVALWRCLPFRGEPSSGLTEDSWRWPELASDANIHPGTPRNCPDRNVMSERMYAVGNAATRPHAACLRASTPPTTCKPQPQQQPIDDDTEATGGARTSNFSIVDVSSKNSSADNERSSRG